MQSEQRASNNPIDIRPLTGAIGCEIYGVDIANIADDEVDQIKQAFLDYSVIMFHDQNLNKEQFGEFGKRFAKLEEEPFLPTKTEVPGVYYFKGAPKGADTLSTQKLGWHADHTYQQNPSFGAMLYAVDVPAAGGDTLFSCNYLSYEGLSSAMKDFVEDKVAIHDVLNYGLNSGHNSLETPEGIERLLAMRKIRPQVEHPLVCKHPETGKKMLYLNNAWTTCIKGLEHEESEAILNMLKQHSLKDIYRCRVRFQNKSLLLWDNRSVQHSPNCDYLTPRSMLRLALHSDWIPGS
jgi:taurine dioxygenase